MGPENSYQEEEESYEQNKLTMGWPAGGYLIGRHIECGGFHLQLTWSSSTNASKIGC